MIERKRESVCVVSVNVSERQKMSSEIGCHDSLSFEKIFPLVNLESVFLQLH